MPSARVAIAAALAAWLTLAGPAAGQDGKTVFRQKCAGCHTIGGGKKVGPDLKGVGDRLGGSDAVAEFVSDPAAVRPGTAMPNLGLTQAEVSGLVAFLTGGAAPKPAPTRPAPPKPARGDAARGKNLFTGAKQLANGGPPCLSCHTIAGIGSLGGGALGPDLTGAYAKYGGATGVPGVLATLPFPTMIPIFRSRGLTAAEQADLLAFLEQASRSKRPGSSVGPLLGLGIGGVAVMFAFALLAWPRRALSVRRKLVNHSRRS